MSPGIDTAAALARGLAAHVQRWATARGAPADAAQAAASAAQALSLATGFDDPDYIAALQLNLAMVAVAGGQGAVAVQRLRTVIDIVDRIGSRPAAISVLDVCTGLAMLAGDAGRAARCHGLAEAECALAGMQRDAADASFIQPHLAAAMAALGDGFPAAVDAGRSAVFESAWAGLPAWLDGLNRS